MGELTGEHAI